MKKVKFYRLLAILLAFIFVASPIIVNAASNGSVAEYPNCDRIKAWTRYFTPKSWSEWCLWSACRSYGYTKTQSAAIIAATQNESKGICYVVEGEGAHYAETGDVINNKTIGKVSSATFHGEGTGSLKAKNNLEYYNTYTKYICKRYVKEHNVMTRSFLLGEAGVTDYLDEDDPNVQAIEACVNDPEQDGEDEDGNQYKMPDKDLYVLGGYVSNKSYYMGIGYYQFTGPRADCLLKFSKSKKKDWWDPECQIAWMFADKDEGGDTNTYFSSGTYKTDSLNKSVEECIDLILEHYVVAPYKDDAATKQLLYDKATNLLNDTRYRDYDWDVAFGNATVELSGHKPATLRTGIDDVTILSENANPTIILSYNSGFILNAQFEKEMDSKNIAVYKDYLSVKKGTGSTSQKYSLYELYGDDIHWYRYLGEATVAPVLVDHIYSAVTQHRTKLLVSPETIIYTPTNYLSCNVYEGRPVVLYSGVGGENGNIDPRTITMGTSLFNGIRFILGSTDMAAAKYFTAFFSLLCGPEIFEHIVDLLTYIETSEVWQVVRPVVLVLLAFATIAFILSIVGLGKKYANGTGAAREVISRALIGFLCLALLFASIARPDAFNGVILKVITCVDQVFDYALQKTLENDDVVCVTDPDMATSAAIWKTAIFGPWCRGQFGGLDYNELYTNYAENLDKGQSAMPQSNDDIDPLDTSGEPIFNSTDIIGDVTVPVGGGYEIRNWAAYLYSCGSHYHIDYNAASVDLANLDIDAMEVNFPTCSTTARNPELNADLFRVIDAQMDISPQYYADGTIINNYTNSHLLKTKYLAEGLVMLFNSLCLLIMVPVLWKKIKSFIMLMITLIKLIYYTLKELFKPSGGLSEFFNDIKQNFLEYFLACVKLNIMLTLYILFIDQGIFKVIIYFILCLVILGFNLKDMRDIGDNMKNSISKIKNKI